MAEQSPPLSVISDQHVRIVEFTFSKILDEANIAGIGDTIKALIVVTMGGIGHVMGGFVAGIVLGLAEQFGALLNNPTAINIGIISSLILPSEALWKRAAYEMQSPMVAALGFSPFTSNYIPSTAMLVYAGLYLLTVVYLANRQFSRRDL